MRRVHTRSVYMQGGHKGKGGAGPSPSQPAPRGVVRGLSRLEKKRGVGEIPGILKEKGINWRKTRELEKKQEG